MESLGVDPPFSDSKTKKSRIHREMRVEELETGITYLYVKF